MKATMQKTRILAGFLVAAALVGLAGCAPSGSKAGPPTGGLLGVPTGQNPSGQNNPVNQQNNSGGQTQTPGIAGLYPAEGSQVCPLPQIGVDLVLSDAMRKNGSFDLSTVTLTLDGKDVTQEAMVPGSLNYPQSRASILYTPSAALTHGPHQAAFTYPSADGNKTQTWTFTVANIACP